VEQNSNIIGNEARSAIFAAVRTLIGRGLTVGEVGPIDAAIERGRLGSGRALGWLSERYESGGCGPGTVSGGRGDPGGASYGLYQLSSRTGTAAAFLHGEGGTWAAELSGPPGTAAFSVAWRTIAAREGERFGAAQHAFIERTHYCPAVAAVRAATAFDLDMRPQALRDAAWSTAVQHGSAARLLQTAVANADISARRGEPEHDRVLVVALYAARTAHVRAIAARSAAAVARTLTSVAERRYPDELAAALAMLKAPR